MTVRELVLALKRRQSDEKVYYDFCGFFPYKIDSYRGDYSELALSYARHTDLRPVEPHTVAQLIDLLEGVVGKVLQGYKGGDFLMRASTPVWVSNYGESNSTSIVGIYDLEGTTYLRTEVVE